MKVTFHLQEITKFKQTSVFRCADQLLPVIVPKSDFFFPCAKLFAVSHKGSDQRLISRHDGPPAQKAPTPAPSPAPTPAAPAPTPAPSPAPTPAAAAATTTHQEGRCATGEKVPLQELSECLGVSLVGATEVDFGCPGQPETSSDRLERMVQRSVEENFPKPPANLKQDLQQHLSDIQEVVLRQLLRVYPLLSGLGLMGYLIGCYHLKIFSHLDRLLQDSRSTQNVLVLLNWVLQTYLRYLLNIFHSFYPSYPKTSPMKRLKGEK